MCTLFREQMRWQLGESPWFRQGSQNLHLGEQCASLGHSHSTALDCCY